MKMAEPIVIRGQSGYLIVPILAVPAATAVAFGLYREHLPTFCLDNAEKVIGLAALFTLALTVTAAFLRGRRLEARGGQLRYRSWLQDRLVDASSLSAVTFESEAGGGADETHVEHYLSLWNGDKVVLRFNRRLWPDAGMRQLLHWLRTRCPALHMDAAVERYLRQR